jgi:hypothetical protein
VGTDFGSFVTHQSGCFIYFGIGNLSCCSGVDSRRSLRHPGH